VTDLSITPSYLTGLAKQQDRAAGEIGDATKAVAGTAGKIRYDHGILCNPTVAAMKACEAERKQGGDTMTKVSNALAANLRQAAADYGATDEQAGGVIDTQMLGR
jgi:hypothetical protein